MTKYYLVAGYRKKAFLPYYYGTIEVRHNGKTSYTVRTAILRLTIPEAIKDAEEKLPYMKLINNI